jgi:hypothetical protein
MKLLSALFLVCNAFAFGAALMMLCTSTVSLLSFENLLRFAVLFFTACACLRHLSRL